MKLYATVKSERAEKGQGGNDYLDVLLKYGTAQDSRVMGCVTLRNVDGDFILTYQNADGKEVTLDHKTLKGEKQKDKGIDLHPGDTYQIVADTR